MKSGQLARNSDIYPSIRTTECVYILWNPPAQKKTAHAATTCGDEVCQECENRMASFHSARETRAEQAGLPSGPSAVGVMLKRFRNAQMLTQQELADRAGISVDTISKLERGRRSVPHSDTVEILIRALGLSSEDADLMRDATRMASKAHRSNKAFAKAYLQKPRALFGTPTNTPPMRPTASASAMEQQTPEPIPASQPQLRHNVLQGYTSRIHPLKQKPSLVILLIALTIVAILGAQTSPAQASNLAVSNAHIQGWVVYQQWTTGTPSRLIVMNAATGTWRALWPDSRILSQSGSVDTAAMYGSLHAPAYSPAQHRLAYIARDMKMIDSIWVATIGRSNDGWPIIEPPGPQKIVANCADCGSLTWSPDGDWLIYDAQRGLVAHAMASGQERQLTNDGDEHWPACSPDGYWLAFQSARLASSGIVVKPAADCLPLAPSERHRNLYVIGFNPAWRPMWSPDSAMLAFVALTTNGKWSAWITDLQNLSATRDNAQTTAATLVSQPGCQDPTWAIQRTGQTVIIYSCITTVNQKQYGSLYIVPADTEASRWQAQIDTGAHAEQGGAWIPQ